MPVPHCSLGCGSHWTERLGVPREREVERESWAERRCNPDAEGNGTRRGCINQTVCWMSVDWSDFLTSACSYNWCYLCMEAILPPPHMGPLGNWCPKLMKMVSTHLSNLASVSDVGMSVFVCACMNVCSFCSRDVSIYTTGRETECPCNRLGSIRTTPAHLAGWAVELRKSD